ncbi:MAG: hypothetical protein IJB98_03635, partial [Clostridia bacterium]|nr:hypothetical protein [Clostridia bacterium]
YIEVLNMENSLKQFEELVRDLRVETLTYEGLKEFAFQCKDYVLYMADLVSGKDVKIERLERSSSSARELCKSILAIIDITKIFNKKEYKNLSYESLLETNMQAIKNYVELYLTLNK